MNGLKLVVTTGGLTNGSSSYCCKSVDFGDIFAVFTFFTFSNCETLGFHTTLKKQIDRNNITILCGVPSCRGSA
jgi:hypothetical protein